MFDIPLDEWNAMVDRVLTAEARVASAGGTAPMTDAEILRAAADILQRRSTKPKSIRLAVVTQLLRNVAVEVEA